MIVAPVRQGHESALRGLLGSMNEAPGRLNAENGLVPFQAFHTLHVARFLLLDDKTLDDIKVYGLAPRTYPLALAFLGDIDGDRDGFFEELARRAGSGLKTLFAHCEGFAPETD